jgi:carboxyl-terminal processing protease
MDLVTSTRLVALVAGLALAVAVESYAEGPELTPTQWKTLAKATRLIKRDYVAAVDDTRLARGCAEGVYALAVLAAARPGPAVNELTDIPIALRAAAAAAPESAREQIVTECLTGMLAGLDAHSRYVRLSPNRDWMPDGASVGVELDLHGGAIVVVDVFEKSPAEGAGIRAGDRLVTIDGRSVDGLALSEVTRRLRGRAGSAVTVTIARGAEMLERPMARAVVQRTLVRSRVIAPAILYLKLGRFEERTLADVDAALGPLVEKIETTPRALLIDLRENSGGLFRTAVDLAAGLLPPGTAVGSTDSRNAAARRRYQGERPWARDAVGEWLRTVPTAVLVNGTTGSGAEIFAAALQAHGRAMLLGSPTAGIGSIQALLPLDDGSYLRLTTAVWVTPKGEVLEGRPLSPDVTLVTARGEAELQEAIEIVKTRRMAPR